MKSDSKLIAAGAENLQEPPWHQKAGGGGNGTKSAVVTCSVSKLTFFSLFFLISLPYFFYSLRFPNYCNLASIHLPSAVNNDSTAAAEAKTSLRHIVFGIAASARLWDRRKEYIKLWYRPETMRGVVWMDKAPPRPAAADDRRRLPPIRISGDTSGFEYRHAKGDRSAIRISRAVSETLRLGMKDVRWFVMGDDDTVFVAENLAGVLAKYDHRECYYIGSNSESHLQNVMFSYAMAYGGGGFAISYPLAVKLAAMQDRCLGRYPALYGSDDRIQACMAEIGVPLTKEPGFHQLDVYGNAFGLLAAHPVTPLLSLHHIDVIDPIFPKASRLQSLHRLALPMSLDPAALMQQSICYDSRRRWTVSVSWGYAVQIVRGTVSPREMEMPVRTFVNWHKKADYRGYAFNTRAVHPNSCQTPFVYTLSPSPSNNDSVVYSSTTGETTSRYVRSRGENPKCKSWKVEDPSGVDRVEVHKRPDPNFWDKAPRRNCCRVLPSKKRRTMVIDVGECRANEVVELR
ncbi:unnamed protein product [Linum trigynum]|uniref:Uncharacterized protein n=1 Tax=Linum trigynum TaxID=586398 RepID=A0AAV2FMD7_9ROSI